MNAVFYEGNRVIRPGEAQPVKPGAGEVQIKVAYGGICGTDLHIFHGAMDNRVQMPQIMGHEMSGVVSEIGADVSRVAVGDRVTVMPLNSCGECAACRNGYAYICHNLQVLGVDRPGAFQGYWTVPAGIIFHLPEALSLKYGALIEPLAVACHDVRVGQVQPGEKVVVLGGGPIGTLIALVARHAGADVLVSEINPFRLQLINDLELNTINPAERDLTDFVHAWTNGSGADAVFEVTGAKPLGLVMTQLLRARGRIVIVGIFSQPPDAPQVNLHRVFLRELQILGARVYASEDFDKAIALAASGDLPLEKIVTDVLPLAHLEQGLLQMESGAGVMKILLEVDG